MCSLCLYFIKTSGFVQCVRILYACKSVSLQIWYYFFFFFQCRVLCEALSCYPFITVMSKYLPCAFDGAEICRVGPISSSGEMLCFSMVIWLSYIVSLLLWFFCSYFLIMICVYLRESKVKKSMLCCGQLQVPEEVHSIICAPSQESCPYIRRGVTL